MVRVCLELPDLVQLLENSAHPESAVKALRCSVIGCLTDCRRSLRLTFNELVATLRRSSGSLSLFSVCFDCVEDPLVGIRFSSGGHSSWSQCGQLNHGGSD